MSDLHDQLVKLAYETPDLRADILTILREAGDMSKLPPALREQAEKKKEESKKKKDDDDKKESSLRKDLIRLAHEQPELRQDLVPLLVKEAADTFECPNCGTKVMEKTGYCVKCQKKVKRGD